MSPLPLLVHTSLLDVGLVAPFPVGDVRPWRGVETCTGSRSERGQLCLCCVGLRGALLPRGCAVRGRLSRLWPGSSTGPDPAGVWQRRSSQLVGFLGARPCPGWQSQVWHPVGTSVISVRALGPHGPVTLCQATVLCGEQEEV